jgi:hypothetical protein
MADGRWQTADGNWRRQAGFIGDDGRWQDGRWQLAVGRWQAVMQVMANER